MSLMKLRRNRKGFTLIEMMIVIAVIAILAAVIIPKSGLVQNTAKESGVEANMRVVQGLVENMLPKYKSTEGVDLRKDLATKIGDNLTNPITGKDSVTVEEAAALAPDGDAVFIGGKDDPMTSTPAAENTNLKGTVFVEIGDTFTVVTITPFDKEGNPMTKAHVTIP